MATKPATKRTPWLDEQETPLLDAYARRLESFVQTMADGRVEESELISQEARLTEIMREVEPLLDDTLHEKVTRLLCELTAYDLMQLIHVMQEARPRAAFRG
jgi:hypothetical protein